MEQRLCTNRGIKSLLELSFFDLSSDLLRLIPLVCQAMALCNTAVPYVAMEYDEAFLHKSLTSKGMQSIGGKTKLDFIVFLLR